MDETRKKTIQSEVTKPGKQIWYILAYMWTLGVK